MQYIALYYFKGNPFKGNMTLALIIWTLISIAPFSQYFHLVNVKTHTDWNDIFQIIGVRLMIYKLTGIIEYYQGWGNKAFIDGGPNTIGVNVKTDEFLMIFIPDTKAHLPNGIFFKHLSCALREWRCLLSWSLRENRFPQPHLAPLYNFPAQTNFFLGFLCCSLICLR